jgi:hypothetical protein
MSEMRVPPLWGDAREHEMAASERRNVAHSPPRDRQAGNRQGKCYDGRVIAAERKVARGSWEARVFRNGWQEMADYDALFWERIPVEARAEAVWELSQELHKIAHPEAHERRLPRSAFCLTRR